MHQRTHAHRITVETAEQRRLRGDEEVEDEDRAEPEADGFGIPAGVGRRIAQDLLDQHQAQHGLGQRSKRLRPGQRIRHGVLAEQDEAELKGKQQRDRAAHQAEAAGTQRLGQQHQQENKPQHEAQLVRAPH